jgi:SRSO17 transposase
MLGRMESYITDYEYIFRSKTKRFLEKAQIYCRGIFMSELSNIERISEEMFANYHQMQHFISDSPWDYRELMDKLALDVSSSLPKRKLTGLIIDESGWEKKGDKSAGVAPQYCGNVGKVSNSQVAVFGALNNGDFASMVDAQLYLPACWCEDSGRCAEAGIPESARQFRKKWEIGLEIIRHQHSLGMPLSVEKDRVCSFPASYKDASPNGMPEKEVASYFLPREASLYEMPVCPIEYCIRKTVFSDSFYQSFGLVLVD